MPVDDGAAAHLTGMEIPSIRLESTDVGEVDLGELSAERLVLYVFPKIGRPDKADPPGWDEIPGARGCTQESCAYRDLHQEFRDVGGDRREIHRQGRRRDPDASIPCVTAIGSERSGLPMASVPVMLAKRSMKAVSAAS